MRGEWRELGMGSGKLATFLRRWSSLLFLTVLFALVWLAYAPSMKQSPRADQWCYLLDTHDCDNFWDLLRASYSYSRTRKMFPMDTELYRPVLFILLAVEKYCLENNFDAIQSVGIVLHCVNIALFLGLLVRLQRLLGRPGQQSPLPRWLPHGLTCFFALNNCVPELVLWSHLHGYLLFVTIVLGSLHCLVEVLLDPELAPGRQRRLLVTAWGLILLSVFTYEMGQFYAIAVALVLGAVRLQQRRFTPALGLFGAFLAIALIYQGVNGLDKAAHAGSFTPETVKKRLLERVFSRDSGRHASRFLKFNLVQPWFPSTVAPFVGWGHRLYIKEKSWSERAASHPRALFLLSCLIGAIAAGAALRGGWEVLRRGCFRVRLTMLLLGVLFLIYAAMIVTGRMNFFPRNKQVLAWNSYYTYMALLFALVPLFLGWLQAASAGQSVSAFGRLSRLAFGILGAGLFVLGGMGGFSIRAAAWDCRKVCRDYYVANQRLGAFVAAHRHEPDFSFTVAVDHSEKPLLVHGVPLVFCLYARWIDNHQPRYVLLMRPRSLDVLSLEEYRQRFPDSSGQINPDIVELSSGYHIYREEGVYYALPSARGWLDREHRDDPALIRADTLAELRQQLAACGLAGRGAKAQTARR
jgi:hypothetical protein